MFLGRYDAQISAKGRVALPAKFRKVTGDRLVIARWYGNCLVIVGISGWEDLVNRFAQREEVVTKPIRSVERFILSTAFEVESDEQGRFVVPLMLRDIANLEGEVVFLGVGDRIELWSKEVWEEEELKVKEEADTMLERIAEARIKK
jgi:MraZ protein